MSHSLDQKQATLLNTCLTMSENPALHADAKQLFLELKHSLTVDGATTQVLDILWREVLSSRRSSLFWQQMSDAEKVMSDRLAENHIQLQQNYLRLVQEQ
jgi:hypothetical protein